MKATGITRPIDDLGRVVIPKEIRKRMHFDSGDYMEFFIDGDILILTPRRLQCVFCGNKDEENLKDKNGVLVCPSCIEELSNE